jgi:hypothetical protein
MNLADFGMNSLSSRPERADAPADGSSSLPWFSAVRFFRKANKCNVYPKGNFLPVFRERNASICHFCLRKSLQIKGKDPMARPLLSRLA